jgi:aerobic-type carbon monoxide dehydrogenase small subunit (CoxS/CutS family)
MPPPKPILVSTTINGRAVGLAVPPNRTLLEVLRYDLDLIGTKQGCDKGDCGACTCQLDGVPVLSCLTLATRAEGRRVDTVENLSQVGSHPLEDAMDRWNAAQCGFCTPGILMVAENLIAEKRRPVTREEAAEALAGNLCRCTGYTKILDAVVDASEVMTRPEADVAEVAE